MTRQEVLDIEEIRKQVNLAPLERFRAKYKHLSVSDLVAPAWCELQFQYALEKTGKKRRTVAMKQGTKMHAALELEVHQTVPFEVSKTIREEKLGLQLLKLYTGLLELQHGNMTRELHVFGTIDGLHIKGVIDELVAVETEPPVSQERAMMDKFFAGGAKRPTKQIILSDAKTRVSTRPPSESQVGQAKLQLMLYRTLLRDMADFDFAGLLERDKLDGIQLFSDTFLAQSLETLMPFEQDAEATITQRNSLYGFWQLLRPTLQDMKHRISSNLLINYIHQKSKQEIARVSFEADEAWQADQMKQVLGWWRGHHEPRGVEIEEAFKCRLCDFEEGCSWKLAKIEEHVRQKRQQRNK